MKLNTSTPKSTQAGAALAMVMIMMAIALAILASVMVWTSSSTKLTHRSIQYIRSVAAAEAATEKAVTRITQDFLSGGIRLTDNNLSSYRSTSVPTTADSPYWSTWIFDDGTGNLGQIYVSRTPGNNYVVLGSAYANLQGYVSTYTVVSHASETASPQHVNAGVLQQLQLTGIPIFQFMMYSSDDMEISCGQPFTVMGRVHSNGTLYVEPDSSLTFASGVTAVTGILTQRDPLDTRGTPAGLKTLFYEDQDPNAIDSSSAFLSLPIGTNNSPTAVREIIEPPPLGEDPTSPLGQLRYYNECDMLVIVSNNSVVLNVGSSVNSSTMITNADAINLLVSTTNSFFDSREGKTVAPIDLNVGNLATWSQTNNRILNLSSVYVVDNRNNLPANTLSAVRVTNGTNLPPNGLTVATARPLYVLGDYNEQSATNMGTANTSTTRPASLVADAITILSDNWSDANSRADVSLRVATPTTVNAAFLTGVVETTLGQYSGGMENFPRFLETWGPVVFTYNGSMVKMFPSLYATNVWGQDQVYAPPTRNWSYDINFDDSTKLPPKTPSVLKMIRGQWATVPPGQNVAVTGP